MINQLQGFTHRVSFGLIGEPPPPERTSPSKRTIVIILLALLLFLIIVFLTILYTRGGPQMSEDKLNKGGPSNEDVLALFRNDYDGEGTYYGNVKEGACSYGTDLPPAATDPKIKALIALNAEQWLGSYVCGLCLRVIGSGKGLGTDPITGDFIVFNKDLCPPCKAGDVDLALDGDGRWDIVIRAVQCPVGNTKIQYSFHGSNQWFAKLQIRNARIPITSVQLKRKATWVTTTHTVDGHWIAGGSGEWQTGPIDIRMTAANGHQMNDTIPKLQNDVVLNGLGVQVPLDPSLPSA